MRKALATQDSSESAEVAALVRLHHRRRGWAGVAAGSLAGLVLYTVLGANLFVNLTGTAVALSLIPEFALLALLLAGLAAVIADSARIRRAGPAVRAAAAGTVSHYPWYAHAHRYPPRHFASWLFGIIMLLAMTGVTVPILPAEVNSVAYLAGAENKDTFNPLSYSQACAKNGCKTVTDGYLSGSGAEVTWGSKVPLGRPFTVRAPVWASGTGRNLTGGAGTAIGVAAAGAFFNLATVVLLTALGMVCRRMVALRRQATLAAGSGPGGT